MSARTDALVSRSETGKMTASIVPVVAGCHPARAFINVFVLIWFHPSSRSLTSICEGNAFGASPLGQRDEDSVFAIISFLVLLIIGLGAAIGVLHVDSIL